VDDYLICGIIFSEWAIQHELFVPNDPITPDSQHRPRLTTHFRQHQQCKVKFLCNLIYQVQGAIDRIVQLGQGNKEL